MKLEQELAELNRKMTEVMETCNDIAYQIRIELDDAPEDRSFLTKAMLGRGEPCDEFLQLSARIRKYKASEAGTIPNMQESINNFAEMADFFQKVFSSEE